MMSQQPRQAHPATSRGLPRQALVPTKMDLRRCKRRCKKMVQRPVYFVSSLLQGARSRYSGVQKLLFGLLMASRKLRHYFQAHEITVVTRFPLKMILQNPEATGRIVEWALELSSFGLKFESTSTIQNIHWQSS